MLVRSEKTKNGKRRGSESVGTYTATSTSAASASATEAITLPLAGFTTSLNKRGRRVNFASEGGSLAGGTHMVFPLIEGPNLLLIKSPLRIVGISAILVSETLFKRTQGR